MADAAEFSLMSLFGGGITFFCALLLSECFADDEALPFLATIALDELLDLPLPMLTIV